MCKLSNSSSLNLKITLIKHLHFQQRIPHHICVPLYRAHHQLQHQCLPDRIHLRARCPRCLQYLLHNRTDPPHRCPPSHLSINHSHAHHLLLCRLCCRRHYRVLGRVSDRLLRRQPFLRIRRPAWIHGWLSRSDSLLSSATWRSSSNDRSRCSSNR